MERTAAVDQRNWNQSTFNQNDLTGRPGSLDPRIYYPYYYSGMDVFTFIVTRDKQLIPLPVTNFQWGMSQEKVPIFGAWSYTWDAIAHGTRMVRGEVSILFTQPNFLGRLLSDDTAPDLADPANPFEVIDEDDEFKRRASLKDSIWGNGSSDPNAAIFQPSGVHSRREAYPFGRDPLRFGVTDASPALYAGHPPFDLLIAFGNDPEHILADIEGFDYTRWASTIHDQLNNLYSDQNDTSGSTFRDSERIYIEGVELLSMGTQWDTSGKPIGETYAFIAKDAVTPYVGGAGMQQVTYRVSHQQIV